MTPQRTYDNFEIEQQRDSEQQPASGKLFHT